MADDTRAASTVDEVAASHALDVNGIFKLRNAVRNSLAERKALQERLAKAEHEDGPKDQKATKIAVFNWVLGHPDQAEAALKNVPPALEGVVRGGVAADRGKYTDAATALQSAVAAHPNSAKLAAELANALRAAGRVEEALKVIEKAEKAAPTDGDLWLQKGWCLEVLGKQQAAANAYEKAVEVDPKNALATFRFAYLLDLRGDDDRAIEMYTRVTGQGSAFVNAMVNLGMLYEDEDDIDNAIASYKDALKADPTNRRAALYLRDAVESLDMYYDETQRKESDRLEAVLRIPVNDFELSVRSRNCLAKMNVKTLGDMVKKTEPELLAYKNFGETSLREIKQLLESKGLRLGMQREEEAKRARVQRMRLGTPPENTTGSKPITDLELSVRARKCMQRLNIESIGDLIDKSEADLLATKNFGQTSLNEVKQKLGEMGLSLKAAD